MQFLSRLQASHGHVASQLTVLYRLTIICSLVLLVAGCGNPSGRQPISGRITFKGKPLDQGRIRFEPIAASHMSGAMIVDGNYVIPGKKGIPPGKYRVEISSGDLQAERKPSSDPYASPPPPPERIPAKYNTKSELIFESTEDGPFEFNVDIP
ncbi:MAG: hypothetical protein SGJ20_11245 [Planctomycetota bacterium]|nr:hypothetical protein [Planctomycetota bacterium]